MQQASNQQEHALKAILLLVLGMSFIPLNDALIKIMSQRLPLAEIVTMRPEVGPLHDRLDSFKKSGLKLSLMVRPEDHYLRSLATSGFFGFWKKLKSRMALGEFPTSNQQELF